MTLHLPVYAQDLPAITPSLQKLLHGLPIAELEGEVYGLLGDLKTTSCGSNLTGCYMTQSGPLQLYFFSSARAQQTLLLVVDRSLAQPKLMTDAVQRVIGDTSLSSPIFSLSTTDFQLNQNQMPAPLLKLVKEKYFNINTLSFSSGVQLAARAELGGPIKLAMAAMGVDVKGNQLMIRSAVVMPIPTDLAGGADAGIAVGDAVAHAETMKKAGADALMPEAFMEIQFAPNTSLAFGMPQMTLTDATFFVNNALTLGYKGNAAYKGAEDKKVIMDFKTPLDPAGGMDLLDFTFRMATPASFTMEDAAHVMVAMATPDPRLAKYGGGFIRNIESFKNPLLSMVKPLSAIQMRNPNPPPEYRFGDSTKPFPTDEKHFNYAVLGPMAEGGPLLNAGGEVTILGAKMGWLAASAGLSGLRGDVGEAIRLKLGPLGDISIKMQATMAINADKQDINLLGNFAGQSVEVGLSGSTMKVEVSASCVNPFEIKTEVAIQASTNIAAVFAGQGGVNVDPSKINNCIGKELEAAYNKIANEFSHLGGYTANAATAELKNLANAAEADYNQAKQAARKAAETSINNARNAWTGGSNAIINAATNVSGGHTSKAGDSSHQHFDPSLFDWDYYYDQHPDLVKNKVDLVAHWDKTGYPSGWRGSLEFDPKFYVKTYPDAVKWAVTPGTLMGHWLSWGIKEGRMGSADFDVKSYLARYPNLQTAFGVAGYEAALADWLTNGKAGNRDGSPYSTPLRITGNSNGSLLDDYRFCKGQPLTGFRLRTKVIMAKNTLYGVQFHYPIGWGEVYGTLGPAPYSAEVTLPANQYFSTIRYRTEDVVNGLGFISNTGEGHGMSLAKSENVTVLSLPSDQKLSCMAGRSGQQPEQLIFSATGTP